MSDTTTAASLPSAERLPTLDILRGFALMGILIKRRWPPRAACR